MSLEAWRGYTITLYATLTGAWLALVPLLLSAVTWDWPFIMVGVVYSALFTYLGTCMTCSQNTWGRPEILASLLAGWGLLALAFVPPVSTDEWLAVVAIAMGCAGPPWLIGTMMQRWLPFRPLR